MLCRNIILTSLVAIATPAMILAQGSDSQFYAVPKTVPEFWRAARFEIRIGNYERAAERIKGLLDLNPDDKTLFDLVEKPAVGDEGGMAQFLKLRNVPRWNVDERKDKEAKKNIDDFLSRLTKSIETELGNAERIRRFINNLAGPVEESSYALREIQRSGKAATPILVATLNSKPSAEVRQGILNALPQLSEAVIPGLVAYLGTADANSQIDLIRVLQKREDFKRLAFSADRDVLPTLWYLAGNPNSPEQVRAAAQSAIAVASPRDPSAESDPELRTSTGQLAETARRFLMGTSNLPSLAGDDTNQPVHAVWNWDGKALTEKQITRVAAVEHYGLRYARWALELKPDDLRSQKIFLAIAIESLAARTGGKPLALASSELYSAIATAPYETLRELLEDSIRDRKSSVVLAIVRALGERVEARAARPSPRSAADREPRPALLVRALDYPEPRIQFAAADAILKIPGLPAHGRSDQIVKILAATLAANPLPDAKQKALLGDPDPLRAEGLSYLLQRVGYDVEVVGSGRELMKRLQNKADIDLVLVDRHLNDPMLRDLLPQLKADRRAKALPVMVVASPEGVTPVTLWTGLARLATVAAFEDYPDYPFYDFTAKGRALEKLFKSPNEYRDLLNDRFAVQTKRMESALVEAGFQMSAELRDKIAYLTIQTLPQDLLKQYNQRLLDEERVIVRRLLPAAFQKESDDYPIKGLRGRLKLDEQVTTTVLEKLVNLMRVTARYEAALPIDRMPEFKKMWESFWNPAEPKLPTIEPIRNTEVELQTSRIVKQFNNVRVVPAVFTEAGFKTELAQVVDQKVPMITPEEKKENARIAMAWLRRIALGEVPGYRFADADAAIRSALSSEDLVFAAIETASRLPSKEAQQDLANVVLNTGRLPIVRTRAAEGLIKHMAIFGKFVTDQQVVAASDLIDSTEDAMLKARLLAIKGVFYSTQKGTGDQLKKYSPKDVPPEMKEEVPPPKEEGKEKEEGKDKEEKK